MSEQPAGGTDREEGYRCTFLVRDPETNEQVECGHTEDNWYDIKQHLRLRHDAGECWSEFSTPVVLRSVDTGTDHSGGDRDE